MANEQTESESPSQTGAPTPIYVGAKCIIRPYVDTDVPFLQKEADNPKISQYMRNVFPSPYTTGDAEWWIRFATSQTPVHNFAICRLDGTFCGGLGLKSLADVEARTMEIGYWVGEAHWGLGITTDAVIGFTRWAFENIPDMLRLEAGVFEGNDASVRVLTKAGYKFEGTRRKACFKHGKSLDMRILGMLREEYTETLKCQTTN